MKRLFSVLALNMIPLLTFYPLAAVEPPKDDKYCLLTVVNPQNNSTFEIYALQQNISIIVEKFDIVSINCPQPSSSTEPTIPEGYLF